MESGVGVRAGLGEAAHDAALAELGSEEEGRRPGPGRVQREELALPRVAGAALEGNVGVRAVGEQRPHQPLVAAEDGGVQRRVPRPGRVRVGARTEQHRGERGVAAVGGHDEGARAGGRGVVRVGAGGQQHPGRREVTATGREQQRGVAALVDHGDGAGRAGAGRMGDHHGPDPRARLHVGPGVEQHLGHAGMPLRHRPHQGGLVFHGFAGVHVGAVGEQGRHRADAAGAGGGHQRRLAARQGGVGRGARLEQRPDQRGVAVLAGEVERGGPELVRGVR